MKAGLVNTYSTQNLGDAAIYSAIATLLSQVLPNAVLEATLDESEPRLVPGLTLVAPERYANYDLHIGVGGDIFNNPRRRLVTRKFLQNLGQLWQAPRQTMLFGQSIPRSCQALSFRLLTLTLGQLAAVCVRDQESVKRLQQAGVKAELSYDTAFALNGSEGGRQQAQHLFDAAEINPEQAILLSVRAFDSMYMRQPERCFAGLVQLCQAMVQRGHRPVVLVQAQASRGEDDAAIAARLRIHVPTLGMLNPFVRNSQCPDWDVAMGALSMCRTIVGLRYHTTVLGLAAGRRPFNLYYANKGQDLTERLGLAGCSIEALDPVQHLAQIEQTIGQSFDHAAIRQRVQSDFTACVRQATHLSSQPYESTESATAA
ncbi:MAG: polysaccharide pyruvyl transferase family protein [Cyanobacteria bacterium J06554_6]